MNQNLLLLWNDSMPVSLTIWLLLTVTSMYLARDLVHQLVFATTQALRVSLKHFYRSLNILATNIRKRNNEVLLSSAREATEKNIEREFHRVNAMVAKDLSGYPATQRKVNDAIKKIEEDFQQSTETPPLPPAWLDAIESIAVLSNNNGDASVAKVLSHIQKTLESAYKETLNEFRKTSLSRHTILKNMLPNWRTISQSLHSIDKNIDGLDKRSQIIDQQMEKYEQIRNHDEIICRTLSSSSMTQFAISTLILIIATLGGIINFQLIALPMSEMVGGTSQLGPMKTSDVAALVIIMLEIAMGIFLMESLRITHLFPIIGSMDDKMRRRMLIITLSILTILASVEASLAYMRDLLALDRETLSQSLAGAAVVEAELRWIPSIGQMILGFILPFTLAFIAIPLESFIQGLRTIMGIIMYHSIQILAFSIRVLANLFFRVGKIINTLYDVVIFIPLQIEKLFNHRKTKSIDPDIETIHS